MSKQLKNLFFIIVGLITISSLSLYTFRNTLLEVFINNQLSQYNLPLQSISHLAISSDGLELQGLIAGNNQELRIHQFRATWNVHDLFARKPISLELDGLEAAIDLGSTNIAAFSSSESDHPIRIPKLDIAWLPIVSLRNCAILLRSDAGSGTISVSGSITRIQPNAHEIHLQAEMTGSLGQSKNTLSATLDSHGNLRGQIAITDGMLRMPEIEIARFSGNTTFTFSAQKLQHARTEFSLSSIVLSQLESSKAVSKFTIGDFILVGQIQATPTAWNGNLDLNIKKIHSTAIPLMLQRFSASLPLQVSAREHGWNIGLNHSAAIKINNLNISHSVVIQSLVELSITQADLMFTNEPQGWLLKHTIAAIPNDVTVVAKPDKSTEIETKFHPGKIIVTGEFNSKKQYRGHIAIHEAALLLAQPQLQLDDIAFSMSLNDIERGTAANFSSKVRQMATRPLFSPLVVNGEIRNKVQDKQSSVYTMNLSIGTPNLHFAQITASHSIDSNRGTLLAELMPLNFSPDGLKPSALIPALDQLENASGQIYAYAQLDWVGTKLQSSSGKIEVRSMSFTQRSITVDDLNVLLNLENLSTLQSPSHQIIAIKHFNFGIPIDNLLIYFRIEQANPPRMTLEKAQFSMLDGMVSLTPTSINPMGVSNITINVSNFDLKTFFDLMQIEGLTGNGHLNGEIPITLQEQQIEIRNGHLAAKTPGVLQLKSEKAVQLLNSGGEEINLLLQTLQDFHYTELLLSLNESVNHDSAITLSLLGNNPKVKDGQEFRLHIRLETDWNKILKAIDQHYDLSHKILNGSFRLH